MANPVLYRFDEVVYRDKDVSDKAQVPYSGAQVSFYFQGATVKAEVPSIAPNALAQIQVHSVGSLKNQDKVTVGFGGAELTVEDSSLGSSPVLFPGATVQFRNTSGQTLSVPAESRLVIAGRRPYVYSDPVGTVPLGSAAVADANGRVKAYVSEPRFDYAVAKAVEVLASSNGSALGGNGIAWNHAGSPTQNAVLIAVSWIPAYENGPPSITEVRYGTQVVPGPAVQTGFGAIYRLNNPPAGAQLVQVTFDSSPVNAVGSAHSIGNLNNSLASAAPTAYGASGVAAPPQGGTNAVHTLFNLLTINSGGPSPIVTPVDPALQTSQQSLGSGIYFTLGATSRNTGWRIEPPFDWAIAGLELHPLTSTPSYFVPDARGGTEPHPSWLNVRDFPDVAAAIAALPSYGGEIFLPSGLYSIPATVLITKQGVTLRGEGRSTILQATRPSPNSSPTHDMFQVRAGGHRFRLVNLQLDGNALGPAAGSCLVFDPYNGQPPPPEPDPNQTTFGSLENVYIQGAGKHGIRFRYTILFEAIATIVDSCYDAGISFQDYAGGHKFIGCSIRDNGKVGLDIGGNAFNVVFFVCQIEGNQGSPENGAQEVDIHLSTTNHANIQLLSCYLERHGSTMQQMIRIENAPGTVVDGCFISGHFIKGILIHGSTSPGCRISNNFGYELTELLRLSPDASGKTSDAVAIGNQGTDDASKNVIGDQVFNLKSVANGKAVALLYAYTASTIPTASSVPVGSLIWNKDTNRLQVSNGTLWLDIGPL